MANNGRAKAKELLRHYFLVASWGNGPKVLSPDHRDEIESIVDEIIEQAKAETLAAVRTMLADREHDGK